MGAIPRPPASQFPEGRPSTLMDVLHGAVEAAADAIRGAD
jgi:hypothetical protein